MGKVNVNSRNNYLTTNGILDLLDSRVDQSLTTTSTPQFASIIVSGGSTVGGDLTVTGNLNVGGSTTIIGTDIIELTDNIIEINSEEVGAGVTLGSAGLEINRGSLTSYRIIFDETNDDTKIGEIGSLQTVATREDSPLNKGIMVYNSALKRLDSTQTIELTTSFTSTENSTSSLTGAIRSSGGIGAAGSITTDGRLNFKGNTYSNYIEADVNDTVAFVVGNNLNFILSAASTVSIPTNVTFSFDGGSGIKEIYATPTLLNIENSTGSIRFLTSSGGSLTIPVNTYIDWGTNNRIRYDSSNLVLESSGQVRSSSVFNVTNATSSISPTTGSILTAGGIASSNTTDATSSTNGGSATFLGGAGIAERLFVGKKLVIADSGINTTQVLGQGLNLRSLSRTLTTLSSNDTTFNSFEGGIISTNSVITNGSTVYIENSPSIIGGGTLVNSYSLYINSGSTYTGGDVNIGDTTASTSITDGALKLVGGISINNSTNSVSYLNGGTFTTDGGVGIRGDIYGGGKIDLAATNLSTTQVANEGINFRSRDRVLTTASAINTTFNSFEGGSISSSATIPIASTVSITSAPSISGGGILTNSYAFHILSGVLYSGDTTTSTSSSSGSVVLEGGLSVNNSTDAVSYLNGGGMTIAGGAAIAKSLYVGGNTSIGSGNPVTGERSLTITNADSGATSYSMLRFGNDGVANFVLFLNSSTRAADGGVNNATIRNDAGELNLQGANGLGFNINSTGIVTGTNTTASTSSSIGALILGGGLSITNATNAVNSTNGGGATIAGGLAVALDAYIGGTFNVDGITNLDQTNIDTTDGTFGVTGINGVNVTVGSASNFTTTSGSVTIDSQAGTLILDGHTGVTIDSATSGISIDAAGASNFTTSSGTMTISGVGATFDATTGTATIEGDNGIEIQTASTVNGINLGTDNPTVPIVIGNAISEVTIGDNLTVNGDLFVTGTTTTTSTIVSTTSNNSIIVNFSPVGTSDGGLVMRRYQTPNDGATGDVIQDTPKESSTFGANSSGNDLTLNAGANASDDYYNGWWILVTSGAGQFQVRRILDYNGTTKVATIYATADNNPPSIVDGLDLTTAVSSGDSYELFDAPYQGVFYDESLDVFKFAAVASAPEAGEFPTTTSLTPLLLKQIYVDDPFPEFNGVIIDYTNTEALLVRKDADAGDVFTVNTTDGEISMANPVNTISSSVDVFLKGLDSVNAVQTYSSIVSTINNNVAGNLRATLGLSVQNDTEGLTTFVNLVGGVSGSSFVDITSSVDSLRILNTTATTSTTAGTILNSGGYSSSNTTDAISTSNGGSMTLAGGFAAALKMFVGGNTHFVSSTTIGNTTNSLAGTEGGVNINGDIGLYNSSGGKIVFHSAGSGAPTFTTRSVGTKIVLLGEISGSSGDFGFGINTDTLWYSTPTTSDSHLFYTGTTDIFTVTSSGVSTLQSGASISMFNGSTTASFKESSGTTLFIPHDSTITNGLQFRDSGDTLSRIRINSDGQLTLGLSGYSGAPGEGKFFNLSAQTFTDNTTAASGTATINTFFNLGQGTLAATNASVTTTTSVNMYVEGAPIRGTNQTFTNAYGIYIDSVTDITNTGTIDSAASLYIRNAPTAGGTGVITNAYALFVEDGSSRFDGKIICPTTSLQVTDTVNTFTGDPGSLNIYGDIVLQNTTRQGIYFVQGGLGAPTLTNRSLGTKIIIYPAISGSTVDSAIGVEGGRSWYSVPSTSESHAFYFGTSRIHTLTSTGIVFDTASSTLLSPDTTDGTDNKGIIITGGGAQGETRGAQIEVYGNEVNSGNLELKSGESGEINLSTAGAERLTVLNSGEVNITSTTDSTGMGTGSLRTSGGANVDLSLFVGTNLTLDFNQAYEFTGDASGRLNIGSKSTGIASNLRLFTNDGDNTDNNFLEIFGLGTKSALTNIEYLQIGYSTSNTEYIINTLTSGTGTVRALTLSTGSNTDQLKLLNNGNVTFSSPVASTSKTSGAIVVAGGIGINNATNSTSYLNGGALTVGGGLAVELNSYFGGNIIVGTGNNLNGERNIIIENSDLGTDAFSMLRLKNSSGLDTVFFMNGVNRTNDGGAGNFTLRNDGGSVRFQSSGGDSIILSSAGITTFSNATASTSSSAGSVVLTGGLSIGGTTDATSFTNGGSVTIGGGLAVEKSTYIGGNTFIGTGNPVAGGRNLIIENKDTGINSLAIVYLINDTVNNVVFFLNSSTRTDDGGVNTATLRNDAGTLRLQSSGGGGLSITSGVVSGNNATASTSSSIGGMVLAGGLAISNATNAVSSTNGGGATIAGGLAVAQDAYIGGNLNVTGTLGITTPSTTVSNSVNITGTPAANGNKNFVNGTYYTFSLVFTLTPTASNTKTSFEFTLPGRSTNFTNVYDINMSVNGYYDATPESIENLIGFAVTGSTRAKVQFTSSSTGTHVVQLTVQYLAV